MKFLALIALLVASFDFQLAQAQESVDLYPKKMKIIEGGASSQDLALLKTIDVTGGDEDDTTSITFTPSTSKYSGKFIFKPLPSLNTVVNIRFQGNVKAPARQSNPASNIWKFQIRNYKTKKWEVLQTNRNKSIGEWNLWQKDIQVTTLADYVNKWDSIVVRLISKRTIGDPVQVDFMKIELTVESSQLLSIGDTFTPDLPGTASSYNTDVVIIDLFDTDAETISSLKNDGRVVICYFSAGSWEDWREDEDSFPNATIGNPLDGWEGENWLDTTSDDVRAIMEARIELAKTKGCQAVDPDNVDGYLHDTSFDLSEDDSKDYLQFLSTSAHDRGLLIGMKNAAELTNKQNHGDFVEEYMDFAVVEECHYYDECSEYSVFVDDGKPVFAIEYTDFDPDLCASFAEDGFSLVFASDDLTVITYCE